MKLLASALAVVSVPLGLLASLVGDPVDVWLLVTIGLLALLCWSAQ